MADTHPNAYRAEAAEKRRQAALLVNEANDLEAKARELEPSQQPPQAVREVPAEEPTNADNSKLFKKK